MVEARSNISLASRSRNTRGGNDIDFQIWGGPAIDTYRWIFIINLRNDFD
jgi:hypothetical protein